MVKYKKGYPSIYYEVLENFLRFDYETQNQILSAFLLHSSNDEILSKEILRIKKYIETKEYAKRFEDYLSSLNEEELKMLQTMLCQKILDYKSCLSHSRLFFDTATSDYDYYLCDFYRNDYSVYPLINYACNNVTRGTYETETIPFDIESFIEQFEAQHCSNNFRDKCCLASIEWAFTEKYHDELLEDGKINIDPNIDELPLLAEDNITLYLNLLSPKALKIFETLDYKDQVFVIMQLPFVTKDCLDSEIEWRNKNRESKINSKAERNQRIILDSNNPKNQRYISGNKFTKKKYPKIRQRGKQRSFAR